MSRLGKIYLLLCVALFFIACGPNRHFPANEQKTTPTPEKTVESAVEKLDTIRQQGFDFVYVFKRKDGGKLDAEDKKFLRANSPPETNQWIVTDEDATAIAGSNYMFLPVHLEALRKRFNVEDLSKPKTENTPEANLNIN